MPELPDLAVIAANLNKRLTDKTLISLILHVDRKAKAPQSELDDALVGKKLQNIYRSGKELRMRFGNDQILALHLMLHGELHLVKGGEAVKFPVLQLDFSNDLSLVLTDWQKQASSALNPEESGVLDALNVNIDFLAQLLSSKKSDIKTILLDQKNIRGIGNAYADEILYDAGISPLSIANAIPFEYVTKIVESIHMVLNGAIKNISSNDPDRVTGENRDFMEVHLPKTQRTQKGEEIVIDKKGSRKTYYTANQILFS